MHLVDLNEIPWQPDAHGQHTKAVESGITLWSFPGPGSFELKSQPQHTWLVLKGRGRLQFGQRIVAISGGVTLSDLHDSYATFMVPQEEEIVIMDVVLAPPLHQPAKNLPPINTPKTEEPTDGGIVMADPDLNLGDNSIPEGASDSPIIDVVTSAPTSEVVGTEPEAPTVTEPEPTDDDPLPWTAKLRSH